MQDILLILLAICGFGVAGVLGAITARDWTEDFLDPLEQLIPNQDTRNAISSDLVDIRNDLAATAVSVNTSNSVTSYVHRIQEFSINNNNCVTHIEFFFQACSLLACGTCGVLLLFIIIALVRYNRLDYTGL
ncbi:MAG: hypothetical protein MJE68_17600 [Proteobacteria bacterium]|nr:hypothetical protein [Pseudomonadota bacterium]